MAVFTTRLGEAREHIVCESWGEYIDFCATVAPHRIISDSTEKDSGWRTLWSGAASLPAAVKLAREGWREGAERMRNIAQRLEARLIHKIVREDWNYDVEGQGFDVARYLTGEPEHWHRVEESDMAENAHRHVRLVYNICASAGIDAKVIEARGATCAALIELLEYAGHRVELWVTASTSAHYGVAVGKGVAMACTVKVKGYDQHMDPSRVAYAVGHPSMLRRLMFSGWEHTSVDVQQATGSGYGLPCENKLDDTSIYLGSAMWGHSQWCSEAGAEAWILGELAAQGVVIRED